MPFAAVHMFKVVIIEASPEILILNVLNREWVESQSGMGLVGLQGLLFSQ